MPPAHARRHPARLADAEYDGHRFLRALRGEELGRHPVVVFCTTENDVAHISEALGAGADEYIMKPFDRSIIEAKLSEVGLV